LDGFDAEIQRVGDLLVREDEREAGDLPLAEGELALGVTALALAVALAPGAGLRAHRLEVHAALVAVAGRCSHSCSLMRARRTFLWVTGQIADPLSTSAPAWISSVMRGRTEFMSERPTARSTWRSVSDMPALW